MKHLLLTIKSLSAILLAVLALSPRVAAAQGNVKVEATIDSLAIIMGDQTCIHLDVTCDAAKNVKMPDIVDSLKYTIEDVMMPQIRDSLSCDIEVVSKSAIDTTYLNDGKRMTLHQDYTITSFNPGLYHLDSFEVMVDTDVYCSNTLALKVWMADDIIPENNSINDEYLYSFCGIKDIRKAPLLFREVKPLLYVLIGLVLVVLLFIYLLRHYIKNQPILRRVTLEPKIPAHIKAGNALDTIKDNKGWTKDDAKAYYTDLTDALRSYIQNRFGINATEMTSSEVMEHITEIVDKEQYEEIRNLLSTSDFAKFAKFQPYENEKVHHYDVVSDFVEKTKPEEVEGQEQVIEYVEVVKGMSMSSKRWLLAGIILAGLIGLLILAWMITFVIFLFI